MMIMANMETFQEAPIIGLQGLQLLQLMPIALIVRRVDQ